MKDFFKSFKEKTGIKISTKDYCLILDTAGQVIADVLLLEAEFKLGGRGGHLVIRMVKPKGSIGACIDWKATKAAGKKVLNFNDQTNGYIARILWDRDQSVFRDKHMWFFKPVRSLKRALKPVIDAGTVQYPVYHNRGAVI
jgi:hypothetical protein